MTVIAMSQEMGTLGRDVANGVAEALGLALVRHEIGDAAADRMHVRKSLIRRFREGQAGFFEKRKVDEETLALYTAEQIYDHALNGNVLIRGWGATMLLYSVPHIPCIRVCAPLENRVRWLMGRLDTDDPEIARAEIERSDGAHATRIRHQFGVTLGDPLLYDLVLNTGRVSIESCVDQIVALSRRPEFQPTPASIGMLRDLSLAAHIQAALRASDNESRIDITPEVKGDRVVLRGVVLDEAERHKAMEVARGVPGVAHVDSELRMMKRSHRYQEHPDND
jgi:cytidylate kinase